MISGTVPDGIIPRQMQASLACFNARVLESKLDPES
ncbi:hypothetical protein ECAE60S_00722 [Eoetvoesiella caeni]